MLPDLSNEPMISPKRIAERHRCGLNQIQKVILRLSESGEIQPRRTPSGRTLLSFREVQSVDAGLVKAV